MHEGLTVDAAGGTGGHFSTFQLEGPSVTGLALDESGLTVEDRDSETLCPMGYYCVDGLRHKCPAVSGGVVARGCGGLAGFCEVDE